MTEAVATRTCAECGRDLPDTARPSRRFCSSRCRQRSWDFANRYSAPPETPVPLHWHVGRQSILTGNVFGMAVRRYWRADGCPPECRTPVEPGGRSFGVPDGKEGLSPDRDWFAHQSEPTRIRRAAR